MNTKIQLRGHCQCCGRDQAVVNGNMAKHGYRVISGWFQGVCVGNQFAPVEHDVTQLNQVVMSVDNQVTQLECTMNDYKNGIDHPNEIPRCCRNQNQPVDIAWNEATELQREDGMSLLINRMQARISSGKDFIKYMRDIADRYHGKELVKVVRAA